jgi:hypothetical protein
MEKAEKKKLEDVLAKGEIPEEYQLDLEEKLEDLKESIKKKKRY